MGTILLVELLVSNMQTSLCRHNPSGPIDTLGRGQITPPEPPSPPPPPPALVEYIVGSNNVPSELAISSSGLHGAHCRVAASLSSLVDVNPTCIISNITSNKYFFSSFNNVDPSHMMLVDCCMLCCRGCGPIAAV